MSSSSWTAGLNICMRPSDITPWLSSSVIFSSPLTTSAFFSSAIFFSRRQRLIPSLVPVSLSSDWTLLFTFFFNKHQQEHGVFKFDAAKCWSRPSGKAKSGKANFVLNLLIQWDIVRWIVVRTRSKKCNLSINLKLSWLRWKSF